MCTGSSPLPAILLSSVTPSLKLIEKRFQALVLPDVSMQRIFEYPGAAKPLRKEGVQYSRLIVGA